MLDQTIAQIVESIERIWSPTRRWFAEDAACVLPMSATSFRSMNIPVASYSERQAMIREELADETGTAADSWSVAYWPDQTGEQTGEMQTVSTLGIQQTLANAVLDTLLRRGLSCKIITGQPQVHARAAQLMTGVRTHEPVALLDWGHESATLTIVDRGTATYSRLLRDCGFRQVLELVGAEFNIDPTDVPALVCGSAFADSSEGARMTSTLLNVAATPIERLKEELQRTFSFVRHKNSALSPKRIIVCGGGATLRGVDSLLQTSTHLPTHAWKAEVDRRGAMVSRTPHALLSAAFVLSTMRWAS